LIASYVNPRKLAHIWYQADAGDGDPATFFYYLRRAAPCRKTSLPLLTPEYCPDLTGFTRRFSRELFGCLSRPPVLVLGNLQDAQEPGQFGNIVRGAAAEIPEGVNLVAFRRAQPPAEFARLQINRVPLKTEPMSATIVFLEGIASECDDLRVNEDGESYALALLTNKSETSA